MGGMTHDKVGIPAQIGTININGTTYTKYRLVIDFGALPNGGYKDVALPISQNEVTGILSITGGAWTSQGYYGFPVPRASNNTSNQMDVLILPINNSFTLRLTNNAAGGGSWAEYDKVYIAIEYFN